MHYINALHFKFIFILIKFQKLLIFFNVFAIMRIDFFNTFMLFCLFKLFNAFKRFNVIKLFYAFKFIEIFNESNEFKIKTFEFEFFDNNKFIKVFYTRTHYFDTLFFYIYF